MKHNRNPLASAIHYALGATMVAGLAMTAAPVAAQDEEDTRDLDRMQVTGSRITRANMEGALPIQVIDRQQIELSGQTSVADLLRQQPINSAGSFRPQSGSSAQSFAGLSLRALGSGRTLILVDGRRAPNAPNVGTAQDLNAVPLAAVERIEILADGASAIYGADAIGGVVNIITRSDFEGVEMFAGISDPEQRGGDTREAGVIFGVSGNRGRIMAGVSNNKRDIIFARDREWSQGGASIFSNNFLTAGFSFLQNPTFGAANTAGCSGPGFSINGSLCAYDFTLVSADEAEVENQSLFARSRYDINSDWSLYGNFGLSRVLSFGRYAPVPSSPWLVGGFGAIVLSPGLPNHPATPPSAGGLNPLWEAYQDVANDTVLLTHRFAANGPRDTSTDAQVYDIDVGVQGRIADFDVDAGVRRTESQYTEIGRNYIVSALAQPQFDSGAYNIYDPFNVPQDVLQSFTATIGRDARYVSRQAYAQVSTDLFDMAAGPVGFAFGAEYRDEDYKDIYDDLQANGNITGSAGNSAFGDRDQWAVFAEAAIPVTDQLEFNVALRHDDYSDFGTATSPKISFRYQPFDELTIRGSWGEGFRAPPLEILSAQPSFSADSVVDAATATAFGVDPTEAVQITTFVIANPNLDAEESEQFSFGVAFEPLDWLNGSIDFWNIEIDGRVAAIGSQTVINCLAGTQQNCPPGLSVFPAGSSGPDASLGLGLLRSADSGQILFAQRGFASLGTIETQGVDINLRTNFDLGEWGRINNELQAGYTDEFITDDGNNVAGDANLPEWRAVLSNTWSYGDFTFAWNMNYIGDQDTSLADPDVGLGSWITHDLQLNYFTPWDGRITIGATNIADKDPILDEGEGRGFNFSLYNGYGRVPYIRYQQNF
ncbi:MAG: TonB-dependent receptor [Pseudomonadota bacterium]